MRTLWGANVTQQYLQGATIALDADPAHRLYSTDLFPLEVYGPNAIGNDQGATVQGPDIGSPQLVGGMPTNLQPYCYRSVTSNPGELPKCPSTIDDNEPGHQWDFTVGVGVEPKCSATTHCWGPDEADNWATRGAINAGLLVYLYLRDLADGRQVALPPYNKCSALPSP